MASEGFKRKLTSIFSADAVGYSRLMGEDEAATVRTLTSYRKIISTLIKQHNGAVIDSPGDNLLAEFVSVVDAVQCAVAVQKEIKARNDELAENSRMQFRIGINLGDVIQEDDRIYGDGVNIAARLEGLAEAGGICISKTAFDQIETKLPLGYEFLGDQSVKNIARPVGAYKVLMEPRVVVSGAKEKKPSIPVWPKKGIIAGALAVVLFIIGVAVWNFYWRAPKIELASKEKMAFPLPDKPSIAVLPFANISGEKELELISDGLAEGIIDGLSRSQHIFVIARNSTFTYKGKPVKVKQVAEEMGVRYVIEGSIQQERSRVRITAQLIDALSGHYLFSERYDRELKDILNLQDEITLKVLTEVRVKLTAGEMARLSEGRTKNLDAYLKVLEATEIKAGHVNKGDLQRSMQLCEEAIALDPEYAHAYATLSTAYSRMVLIGASDSPRESLRRAVEIGKKAIALDESRSGILVWPYALNREFDKAIEAAEKSVSLSPNFAGGYFALGAALVFAGRHQEAIPVLQKCLRLSPVPYHMGIFGWLATSYSALGQYEEAVVTRKKSLQIYGPDLLEAHVELAANYIYLGRENEARAEAAEVLRIDPKFSMEQYDKNYPTTPAKRDRFHKALLKAGLK